MRIHYQASFDPMRCLRRAFTLIELLIVVAIIAILAAIAVPNFLEAQTRSKVSRVKADLRAMATAMEAYAVDWNKYPTPADATGALIVNPAAAVTVNPFETRIAALLTTPVAYITSRPTDPFMVKEGESSLYHTYTFEYVMTRQTFAPTNNWLAVWHGFFIDIGYPAAPPSIRYLFVSFGPDKDHDADVPHITAPTGPHTHGDGTLYDPTNGTISSGDILYAGPGFGFLGGK